MAVSLPGGWKEGFYRTITLYVQDTRMPFDKHYRLLSKPWAQIKDIKDHLYTILSIPSSRQRLFYKGKEITSRRTLADCGIWKDNQVLQLSVAMNQNRGFPMLQTIQAHSKHFPKALLKTLYEAQQGITLGYVPELSMEGTGGTYFLRDANKIVVGCFKPQDEEPFCPSNPRGFQGEIGQHGFRKGVLSGEACEREVAAYLLDTDHFASVPPTGFIEAQHPVFQYEGQMKIKHGSLQRFVRHDDVASDLSPSMFSIEQVHKVALFDIRLLNLDRHDANILVRRRRARETNDVFYELVPIDHGFCLPDTIEIGWCDWCWYNWPQLKEPLSPQTRRYVLEALDVEKDVELLHQVLSIREECIQNYIIASLVLKKGVQANLTLFQIASIICREDLDQPSQLEKLIQQAHDLSFARSSPAKPWIERKSRTTEKSLPDENVKPFTNLRIDVESSFSIPEDAMNSVQSPQGFWQEKAEPFAHENCTDCCDQVLDQAAKALRELELTKSIESGPRSLEFYSRENKNRFFQAFHKLLDQVIQQLRPAAAAASSPV